METFPRDRLGVLSIHQAKGLEFPLTIVDAGSDFRDELSCAGLRTISEHWRHTARHGESTSPLHCFEAPSRSAQDRAFDDLYRQFFVAYSRPQEVLLLVGLAQRSPVDQFAT